jgi:hypothetical protein
MRAEATAAREWTLISDGVDTIDVPHAASGEAIQQLQVPLSGFRQSA